MHVKFETHFESYKKLKEGRKNFKSYFLDQNWSSIPLHYHSQSCLAMFNVHTTPKLKANLISWLQEIMCPLSKKEIWEDMIWYFWTKRNLCWEVVNANWFCKQVHVYSALSWQNTELTQEWKVNHCESGKNRLTPNKFCWNGFLTDQSKNCNRNLLNFSLFMASRRSRSKLWKSHWGFIFTGNNVLISLDIECKLSFV